MTEIKILFSTKEKENAENLLRSIEKENYYEKEKNYSLSIFIIDKTMEQDLESRLYRFQSKIEIINLIKVKHLEEKYSDFLKKANCIQDIDSIQRARIQQQILVIDNFKSFENSIIWQVDDDMLFGKSEFYRDKHTVNYSTNYFSKLVKLYHDNKDVDVIIAPSTYVPPIPSLLYCETQLNDFFKKTFNSEAQTDNMEYHDFYSNLNEKYYYSFFLSDSKNKTEVTRNILIGKPITKVSYNESHDEVSFLKSKLLRGGNFIVFNPKIFTIPHLGFSEANNIPARRSDMIHSRLLSELGFEIRDISYFSLVHNRSFRGVTIENCIEKYYSDMIGVLLVLFLYKGIDEYKTRLEFYKKHIKRVLKLLYDNVNIDDFTKEIKSLVQLESKINSYDEAYYMNKFKEFKIKKENLKEYANRCNRVK